MQEAYLRRVFCIAETNTSYSMRYNRRRHRTRYIFW